MQHENFCDTLEIYCALNGTYNIVLHLLQQGIRHIFHVLAAHAHHLEHRVILLIIVVSTTQLLIRDIVYRSSAAYGGNAVQRGALFVFLKGKVRLSVSKFDVLFSYNINT